MSEDAKIDAIVAQLGGLKKYREVGVHEDTIRDIVRAELAHHKKQGEAVKSARRNVLEFLANDLGDPYSAAQAQALTRAFALGDRPAIRDICIRAMRAHLSTRERLPLLDDFYARIFAVTGRPRVLLDVACALNPLAFDWMDLPEGAVFHGYDIHRQRVDFLNHYFNLAGIAGGVHFQDVLVDPPTEAGDVALLLKEVARLEKRQRGVVLPLLDALPVRYIVASLPAQNRGGSRDLSDNYRDLFYRIIGDRPWPVTEIPFENELVFVLDKAGRDVA